jgi:hypothetical protein
MPIAAKIQKSVSKAPKIWMVTGLQYIKDASVASGTGKGRSAKLQATLPVPDPTLMATLANIPAIDVSGSTAAHNNMNETYAYKHERIWAAQFRALNVQFRSKSEKAVAQRDNSWIELDDAKNLGRHGIRDDYAEDTGEEESTSLAQVTGVSDEGGDIHDPTVKPQSILDTMLEVNWTLLNELLRLQDDGDQEEDG